MFDKDDAIAIKKFVEIEGIKLWKEKYDYIINKEEKVYLYNNNESQESHIKDMVENGWIYVEQKKRECLYGSFTRSSEESIYVLCAYFFRKII